MPAKEPNPTDKIDHASQSLERVEAQLNSLRNDVELDKSDWDVVRELLGPLKGEPPCTKK